METINILVVDDDREIVNAICKLLESEGYKTLKAYDGLDAIDILNQNTVHLIILDIMMPNQDGLTTTMKIRNEKNIPIILLSAKTQESDIVLGLSMGADDYISKPFRVKELLARIKSVLRRYSKDSPDGIVSVGSIKVNTNEAKIYKNGAEIILTAMEYKLLLIFINNRGKVLSRQRLLEDIWDVAGDFVNDNTLTVYIKRLRDKIEEDPAKPQIIKTVRGLGYIIDDEK